MKLKITPQTGTAIEFIDISTVNITGVSGGTRLCQLNSIGLTPYQMIRKHVPGTNGNYIIRGGRTGGLITSDLIYFGTLLEVESLLIADQNLIDNQPCTLLIDSVTTFEHCNVIKFEKTGEYIPYDDTHVIIKATSIFQRD